jgi:hypothetical protein
MLCAGRHAAPPRCCPALPSPERRTTAASLLPATPCPKPSACPALCRATCCGPRPQGARAADSCRYYRLAAAAAGAPPCAPACPAASRGCVRGLGAFEPLTNGAHGSSRARFYFICLISTEICKIHIKSRKSAKNMKSILFECLDLYLQRKNIYSYELLFLLLLQLKLCLDLINWCMQI